MKKYKPSDPYLNIKLTKPEQEYRKWSTKIKWTSKVTRVDLETGEIITKHNAETNYIKIKTEKHGRITNKLKTRGELEITIGYTRNPQRNIFTQ